MKTQIVEVMLLDSCFSLYKLSFPRAGGVFGCGPQLRVGLQHCWVQGWGRSRGCCGAVVPPVSAGSPRSSRAAPGASHHPKACWDPARNCQRRKQEHNWLAGTSWFRSYKKPWAIPVSDSKDWVTDLQVPVSCVPFPRWWSYKWL